MKEGAPIPIELKKHANKITYGPDGSKIITTVDLANPEPQVTLGHAHKAEGSHALIAIVKNVGVVRAKADADSGVTELEKMDDTVAAAHVHEGGAGFDMWVLKRRGANIGREAAKADAIKATYKEERDAMARRLAIQGSATGAELLEDFQRIQTNKKLGNEVRVTVFVRNADGTERNLQTITREKAANVMIPGEWIKPMLKNETLEKRKSDTSNSNLEQGLRETDNDNLDVKPAVKARIGEINDSKVINLQELGDKKRLEAVRAELEMLQPVA